MKSFFSKKSILRTMAVAAVCMLGATSVKAQEFTIQGDFVSSYVWRGIYQGGAASFQPTLGFSVGNFSLTAWGSTSLSESNKEIDLTAAYKFGETGPALSVATLCPLPCSDAGSPRGPRSSRAPDRSAGGR